MGESDLREQTGAVEEFVAGEGSTGIRILRFGIPDRFVTHGSRDRLLEEVGLVPDKIAAAVREALGVAQAHVGGRG